MRCARRGKRRESLALAHAMVIEARAAHHPPLLARALLALAIARAGFDDPGVLSVLEEAAAVAGEAHDDARTVRALTLLVQKLGRYGKPAEALALRPAVAALIARSGNLEQQAWLHQSTGYVLSEEGDQAGAEPELRLALALAERAGATGPC
jgi:hypothetical protein